MSLQEKFDAAVEIIQKLPKTGMLHFFCHETDIILFILLEQFPLYILNYRTSQHQQRPKAHFLLSLQTGYNRRCEHR